MSEVQIILVVIFGGRRKGEGLYEAGMRPSVDGEISLGFFSSVRYA